MNLSVTAGGDAVRSRLNRNALRWCCTAAAAFCIAGCAVGPNYKKVAVDIPESFKEGVDWQRANANPQASLSSTWWLEYSDTTLAHLVEQAQKVLEEVSRIRDIAKALGTSIGTHQGLWDPQAAVLGRRFRLCRRLDRHFGRHAGP